MYLGIDVGGTKIDVAIYDGKSMESIDRVATPRNYESFIVEIKRMIDKALQMRSERIKCVGFGVPATVKNNRIDWAPNIPYLNGVHLRDEIRKHIGVEAFIANDAQLSLLGESWKGVAQTVDHVVLISIGTGVGGAIMFSRKIVQGKNGSAGALGWINSDLNEPGDPEHGYTERHASGSALMQVGNRLNPALTSYQIIEKARLGEECCLRIIDGIAYKLGAALATTTSILEPDLIVFSGGLSEEFDLFKDGMRKALYDYASPSTKETPILVGRLGAKAGVYGAVRAGIMRGEIFT